MNLIKMATGGIVWSEMGVNGARVDDERPLEAVKEIGEYSKVENRNIIT